MGTSYLGSKGQSGVYQRIIGNMPPHSVYIEPFLGSGKIMLTKRPAAANVGIDADAGVIGRFAAGICAKNPGVEMQFFEDDSLRWIDWNFLTAKCLYPSDTLIYCDPPYLFSTRTSRHRYRHEFGTEDQHAALLTLLLALKCNVMISGYPSPLYDKMLKGWRCDSYQTRTRGRTLTECLWSNYGPPDELHDWRFIGANFRERLNLKRVAARFNAKLERMTPLRRNFILNLVRQRQSCRLGPADHGGKGVAR